MLYIAHRGNIDGRSNDENTVPYLKQAISKGYHVCVDVWHEDNSLWVGSTGPSDRLGYYDLFEIFQSSWFRCRDVGALSYLYSLNTSGVFRYFWNGYDTVSLVSNGKFWLGPGVKIIPNSIVSWPEHGGYSNIDLMHACGICSDYVSEFKDNMEASY